MASFTFVLVRQRAGRMAAEVMTWLTCKGPLE
jgi:hypothetical protein